MNTDEGKDTGTQDEGITAVAESTQTETVAGKANAGGGGVADAKGADDELLDVGGEFGKMTRAELRNSILRDADYRKKTTSTAVERKQLEQERKELEAERQRLAPIQSRLSDNPELVDALAKGDIKTIARLIAPEDQGLDEETSKALEEFDPRLAQTIKQLHGGRQKDREAFAELQGKLSKTEAMQFQLQAIDVKNQFSQLESELKTKYADKDGKIPDGVFDKEKIMAVMQENNLEWEADIVRKVWEVANRERLLQLAEARGEKIGEEKAAKKHAIQTPRSLGEGGAAPVAKQQAGLSQDARFTAEIERRLAADNK